jgi:hypothetical protein
MAELRTVNPLVAGSIPALGAMEIIDDFISPSDQDILLNAVSSSNFPYRLYPTHIYENQNDDLYEEYHAPLQFTHFLYMHGEEKRSAHLGIIRPIFDSMHELYGQVTLFRAKVNLTTPQPQAYEYMPQIPHTDMKYDDGTLIDHQVLLYYINDADGPTYFFNETGEIEESVNPKKGRAIVFDGSILHAGSSPVDSPFRYALNINFRKGVNQIP